MLNFNTRHFMISVTGLAVVFTGVFLMTLSQTALADVSIRRTVAISSRGPESQPIAHPSPEKNQRVVVIRPFPLYAAPGKSLHNKVEILYSMTALGNACNEIQARAPVEVRSLPSDSSLTYMVVGEPVVTRTKKGCMQREPIEHTITVHTNLDLLPLTYEYVIYVPDNITVQYRVWKPGDSIAPSETIP